MKVEVCYALATGATRIEVDVEAGATVQDAVDASGVVSMRSLDLRDLSFAIYGRRAAATTPLDDGDRVEILRPLQVDPKEARHRRVVKKRVAQGGPTRS